MHASSPAPATVPSTGHRYLLVARVGRNSLHRNWLAEEARRNFDVLLSSFDPQLAQPRLPGVYMEQRPGTKAAGIAALLEDNAAWIGRYRYVAVFDDDLDIGTEGISRLFALADEHNFRICQPALSHDSHFSFAALLQQKEFEYRTVNFVEMMCPCFRNDMLAQVQRIYALGYESGLDLLWCNLHGPDPSAYAVLDAVQVRHTRPVGVARHANGFADGETYEDQIQRVTERFEVPWLACVPYIGRRHDGQLVHSRLALLWSSLGIAVAVTRRRDYGRRLRAVLTHWKHLLTRQPDNLRLVLDGPSAEACVGRPSLAGGRRDDR